MPSALPTPAYCESEQSNLTPEVKASEIGDTNTSVDTNTIVDVSVRLERFVLCVVIALVSASSFLLLMSKQFTLKTLEGSGKELTDQVDDVVEKYKSISAILQFTGSTIFAVFSETLIFPTLANYLHNCSLYPGDQPARVQSTNKERCIFWGLKTIVIIMNIGFTSVSVNTANQENGSRRLVESD